jgi:hypothetical protein
MIASTLNGDDMPPIEQQFLKTPLDKAADIETLDNSLYTDFAGERHSSWAFHYDSLSQAEYDGLKAKYDDQFVSRQYPLLSIPFYSVSDVPCRMYINEQDIWSNCGDVQNVQITFRETSQLPEVS